MASNTALSGRIDTSLTFVASRAAMLAVALLLAASAHGQALDEVAQDLVHSDLPIFGHGGDNEWPQHFYDDESFGCTSPVAFGDWAFHERGAQTDEDVQWYRFSNYGVFHCWANTFRASERGGLDAAEAHPSFFVLLGKMSANGADIELWVVQIGAMPGSEYLLLSRDPGEGLVKKFNVLQTECPRGNVRDAGSLDILLTRYCAVNSRSEIERFARRMAQRPPLGTLTLMPDDAGKVENAGQ